MGIRDTVIAFGTVSGAGQTPGGGEAVSAVGLRLETHLATHPEATFYLRTEGDGWGDSGLAAGDLLVVDRSVEPRDGAVVIAHCDGALAVRRLGRDATGARTLTALRPGARPQRVDDATGETAIWGVVGWTIRKL